MIFLVNLEVLGELIDRRGERRDLNFGRAGIVRSAAVRSGNLRLLFFGERHRYAPCSRIGSLGYRLRVSVPATGLEYQSRAGGASRRSNAAAWSSNFVDAAPWSPARVPGSVKR